MTKSKTLLPFDATKPGVLVVGGKKFVGKVFHVASVVVELYPLQALAKAVNRQSDTMKLWEKAGWIHPPLFRVTGTPLQVLKRYYSREQIINSYQVYNRFPYAPNFPRLREQFFTLFNMVFDEGEIIDVAAIPVSGGNPSSEERLLDTRGRFIPKRGAGNAIPRHSRKSYQRRDASGSPTHAPGRTQSENRGPVAAESRAGFATHAESSRGVGESEQHQHVSVAPSERHAASPVASTLTKRGDFKRRPKSGV